MRSSPWMAGLLACTTRRVRAQTTSGSTPIPVTFGEFENTPQPRVLIPREEDQKLFWKLEEGITVDFVEIWNGTQPIGQWSEDKGKDPTGKTDRGLQSKDGLLQNTTIIALTVTNSDLDGNLVFNIPAILSLGVSPVVVGESQIWAENLNKALHVKLSWSNDRVAGIAEDSPFVVASNEDPPVIAAAENVLSAAAATSTPVVSTTTTFTNGGFATSTGSTSSPSAPTAPSPSPSSTAPNGLSSGAIAGIAVGAVALLAIVGVLVWFFCFRRRKLHSQTRQTDYGHDAGTRAMMVDKEVPGVSESSPHSAYGDDGGRLHDRSSTAMDSSYAPYRDHTPTMAPAPIAHGSPATTHAMVSSQTHLPQHATSAPTPPPATQYAHLVEEGMTPDEIRRLEEEERALDQDIEASRANH